MLMKPTPQGSFTALEKWALEEKPLLYIFHHPLNMGFILLVHRYLIIKPEKQTNFARSYWPN